MVDQVAISSTRRFNTWPSWHCVFEWEDIYAESLDCPIRYERKIDVVRIYRKAMHYIFTKLKRSYDPCFISGKKVILTFVMDPRGLI